MEKEIHISLGINGVDIISKSIKIDDDLLKNFNNISGKSILSLFISKLVPLCSNRDCNNLKLSILSEPKPLYDDLRLKALFLAERGNKQVELLSEEEFVQAYLCPQEGDEIKFLESRLDRLIDKINKYKQNTKDHAKMMSEFHKVGKSYGKT